MSPARKLARVAVCLALACYPLVAAADIPPATRESHATLENDIDGLVAGTGVTSRMHSLLVSRRGEIIFERYFNGHGPADADNVKSVSKSILSALVGIAIEQGYIDGVDMRMPAYFGDELGPAPDPTVAAISVEDLLTMQAGLQPTSNRNYGPWVLSDNWISAALTMPMVATPGREMLYSTGNTHLLSAILTRASGQSTLEFARHALAEPLGFDLAPWPRDPQGVYFGGNDMVLTPRDLLAFGELYLNGGRIGGRQIVPETWVEASLAPHATSPHGEGRYYGYGWWVTELAGQVVPHAWGHGGQFIMLVPELDLVLVTTSQPSADAQANAHANKVYGLLQYIIRYMDGRAATPLQFAERRPGSSMH